MDIFSLLGFLLLIALTLFWLDSLRVLEIARAAAKQTCAKADLQFLDDTVAGVSLKFARDDTGKRVFHRTYRFEFTETGNTRVEGQVVMLGAQVESVTMDPYRILE